ncbi:MAG: M23 family metallopeptidase [Alphaproteobacteria bacterium]|nr:M23 family metallopeptidase [Alphaproteobacteria bacterium]
MIKKVCSVVILIFMLTGCYNSGGQVRLFNKYSLFGSTPSTLEVEKGDTLYSISKRYDVSLNELIKHNNLRAPYSLKVGQTLKLPLAKYHMVKKGDTLYAIARKYNTNTSSLVTLNGLKPPYSLNVGQKLQISGSSSYVAAKKSALRTKYAKKNTSTYKKSAKSTYVAPKNRTAKFAWPVRGRIISGFGTIGKGRKNDGINIKAPLGTDVKAADKGVVAYAGNELKGFGNLILIKHPDGWITAYAHNQKLFVRKGQQVVKGEKIATVGQTGGVDSPQLHFEVRAGKKAVNPRKYLP